VLDDGKMVGLGTHDELVETCETYREIVESQLSVEAQS
jgi:ATP-binding cassette subfamily B protein